MIGCAYAVFLAFVGLVWWVAWRLSLSKAGCGGRATDLSTESTRGAFAPRMHRRRSSQEMGVDVGTFSPTEKDPTAFKEFQRDVQRIRRSITFLCDMEMTRNYDSRMTCKRGTAWSCPSLYRYGNATMTSHCKSRVSQPTRECSWLCQSKSAWNFSREAAPFPFGASNLTCDGV